MALDLSRVHSLDAQGRRSWHGSAFIVESLVLLAFLVASLAVVMQLMAGAHERGTEADALSNAIVLASNNAEAFAAAPTSGDQIAHFTSADGELVEVSSDITASSEATIYNLTRTVKQSNQEAGTLYSAHIAVQQGEQTVYELDTSRYVTRAEVGR